MSDLLVAIDWDALGLAALFLGSCYLLHLYKLRFKAPTVYVSDISSMKRTTSNMRVGLSKIVHYLPYIALGLLLFAFINPRYFEKRPLSQDESSQDERSSTQGIALYFVLDQSGSMTESVPTINPEGIPTTAKKIDLLRNFTKMFIQGDKRLGLPGRHGDLIGLVEFARTANLIVPLTLDTHAITDAIDNFHVVESKEDDGTAIGYAIYKTANLIAATRHFAEDQINQGKPAYDIKNSVIVLVTDGLQDPNPRDIGSRWRWIDPAEAARYASDNGIKLYIINVEPGLAAEQFTPNRNQLQKAAEATGGKFYLVTAGSNLAEIYSQIDKLEKSQISLQSDPLSNIQKNLSPDQLPQFYQRHFLYPLLIALGILCLAIWILFETALLRRVP